MDTRDPVGARRRARVRWLVVAAYVLLLVTDAGAATLAIASGRATSRSEATARAGVDFIQNSSNLTDSLLDAETAQRGYLLTGQLSYLTPYRVGLASEPALLAAVLRGGHGDRALEADGRRLAPLVHAKLAELAATLELQSHGHPAAALALVRTNRGDRLMSAIRQDTAAMSKRSEGLLAAARKTFHASLARSNHASLVAYCASALLVALMLLLLRGYAATERERRVAGWAQLEAERLNDEKTGFLSRVSHELRTPLNAILGFGQLLEMDQLEPDQREKLAQILAGGQHLLVIVDDVLDISRVESGELRLSTDPVQLAEVMQEAQSLASPQAAPLAVGLRKQAIPAGLWVAADRQRLMQVLLNLISNAIKYNRPGGNVTLSAKETASGDIRIEVTDTGIGISHRDIDGLFTPFERLDAASRGIEGTGLGLGLAKGLTEAMGGSLGMLSKRGVGSTAWIELPAGAAPVALRHPPTVPAPRGGRKSSQGSITVLYVEDNRSNVKLVEKILALREEVTLIVATDGASGVRLAREHHPTVVLLDLHLPDTPGASVLRQLREHPATADIPVVIVSADASPIQVKRLGVAGASGYLTKPFDVNQLLDAIDFHSPQAMAPAPPRISDTGLLDAPMVASLHTLAANPHVGPAQVTELLSDFRHDANERLTSLRAALDDHDLARVVREAHSLAGASGAFGAKEFRYACREIEEHAKTGREADARTLDATLDDLLARTWNALELEFAVEPSSAVLAGR